MPAISIKAVRVASLSERYPNRSPRTRRALGEISGGPGTVNHRGALTELRRDCDRNHLNTQAVTLTASERRAHRWSAQHSYHAPVMLRSESKSRELVSMAADAAERKTGEP